VVNHSSKTEVSIGRLPRFDLPTEFPVPGDRKTIHRNPFDIIPLTNPFDIPLLGTLPIHPNTRPPVIPAANTNPQQSGRKPYVLVPKAQPVTTSNEPPPPVAKLTPPRTTPPAPPLRQTPPPAPHPRRTGPHWVKSVAGFHRPGRVLVETSPPPTTNDMDVDPPSDESSDIEGDLEVADTPTSSQGAIGEGHSNSDEMDASDNEVVVRDGKYTPRKMHIADDSDMQVIGSLHPTGSTKADRKGKRKAVESHDTTEDSHHAGLNIVNPVDNLEAASCHAPAEVPVGTSGSAYASGGAPGSSGASGSGVTGPIGGPSTTHPADLIGEIAGMLDKEKTTTESIQANFQHLVCFLSSMISIYILTLSTQNSNWTISPQSNSAYHLITASTSIQKDLARTTGVLKQLLEVDKILSEATSYADDALEKLEGLIHRK
jgi:hypothetical protein